MTIIGAALSTPEFGNAVDHGVDSARAAKESGLSGIWLGQRFDYDAIALAGIIGREVDDITVGTSAVPIFGRHPLIVAGQAQTAQAATHGRFQYGLALGAAALTEKAFGVEFRRPAKRLADFLTITRSVLETGEVDYRGTEISAVSPIPTTLAGVDSPPPVLVAALGPRVLEVAGRFADGILPFLAGPKVLETQIIPTLAGAAVDAGRPPPRVVALVPALVTDDPDAGRAALAAATSFYEQIPSYQRVIELSGARRAVELGLVGSADEVRAGLRDYLAAGATEIVLTQTDSLGPQTERATWEAAAVLGR
ncbi:putative F420-dependent oxidoreductase [Gordonia effusa NBRC 100432]|uniref:Putative F420-dependent oxidoreductase n=1 Tax=Gordonia effusa NBRC 100432 TaxID=1077974 RepID=H0QXU8_9ACTN|nr:TIGR03564 family F420-dependent LLM class oxidoreductase [Gordonia effusa]GAB17649.1 putative F420-dependent oxidoreductase [Gordonia effusa NBRC 100432]